MDNNIPINDEDDSFNINLESLSENNDKEKVQEKDVATEMIKKMNKFQQDVDKKTGSTIEDKDTRNTACQNIMSRKSIDIA